MFRFLALAVLLCLPIATSVRGEDDLKPMFNGRDLSGWQRVNTDESTWSVRDGMLICTGKPIGELRTKRMYQNFVMEVEWRHMKPRGNAGIFIWADDITAKGQPFHRGIEIQVLENAYGNTRSHTTHGDIFPIHGAKMKPINGRGGSRAFPTAEHSKPSPEWNHYRIEAKQGKVSLSVNGHLVTQGTECRPSKGYICIESEGGIVHYRNMKIKELPDSPVADEDIAIADRGYRCLYTGIDLSMWDADDRSGWSAQDWRMQHRSSDSKAGVPIESKEKFEPESGLLIDFRFSSVEDKLTCKFAGITILLSRDVPAIAKLLEKPKRWHRLELSAKGDSASCTINGQAIPNDAILDSSETSAAPLRLEPTGSVDVANIYVRSL